MKNEMKFTLSRHSEILTPDVPSIDVLFDCLRRGATIKASQSAGEPIAAGGVRPQWLMCETSGSSGQPKVIRRKPDTWNKSFAIASEQFSISSDDTYATLGALGHSLTLYATVEALSLGADICSLTNLGPQRQVRAVQSFGVSILYATPTQLALLLKGAALVQINALPHVRHIFSGGGKLSSRVKDALHRLFPAAHVHEIFGASETSFITMSDENTPPGSVGRLYPGVQLRIATTDNASAGELWVASPYLFDGYEAGDHPDTQWDGAYLSIGEMGYMDGNGYLFLSGRKNRMVTVADTNVFPEEVERCVMQLDAAQQCAVVTAPDKKRGNRLICFVQSIDESLTPAVVHRHCQMIFGQHSVPKDIRIVDKIPMLAAGKPDLQLLREIVAADG